MRHAQSASSAAFSADGMMPPVAGAGSLGVVLLRLLPDGSLLRHTCRCCRTAGACCSPVSSCCSWLLRVSLCVRQCGRAGEWVAAMRGLVGGSNVSVGHTTV